MTLTEQTALDVNAWLDESWDPELTVEQWWARLADARLAHPMLPEPWGRDWSREETSRLVRAMVERKALGPPSGLGMMLAAPTIIAHAADELQQRLIPQILNGQHGWCQLFSEPGAGSDLAGLSARAVHDPDAGVYRITGQKLWTSRAQYADWCYVLARTEPQSRRHQGISMLLMRMDQPGVEVRPLRSIAGSLEFNELFLDGAVVEERDLVGAPGDGWKLATFALGNERGTRLVERALKFRKEQGAGLRDVLRTSGGEQGPAGGVPDSLAEAHIDARVVDAMAHRILALSAEGAELGALSSMSKLVWSEGYQRFLTSVNQAFGVRGLADTPPYDAWHDRLLRGRAATIYGGTSEVQRNIIAKSLGLPASSAR